MVWETEANLEECGKRWNGAKSCKGFSAYIKESVLYSEDDREQLNCLKKGVRDSYLHLEKETALVTIWETFLEGESRNRKVG